jgi:hypothetical protein
MYLTFDDAGQALRQSSARARYLPLASTYRREIQEEIQAHSQVARVMATSVMHAAADFSYRNSSANSDWLLANGNPVIGLVSLQI